MFTSHGLRATRQRLAVYEALAATKSHPTADDLYRAIGNGRRDMSLATIYNTLEALCRAGLAQKLSGCAGSARYDATVHNHLHLRDEFTGSLADVPDDLGQQILNAIPPQMLRQLESELGFRVERLRVELVGRFDERNAVS